MSIGKKYSILKQLLNQNAITQAEFNYIKDDLFDSANQLNASMKALSQETEKLNKNIQSVLSQPQYRKKKSGSENRKWRDIFYFLGGIILLVIILVISSDKNSGGSNGGQYAFWIILTVIIIGIGLYLNHLYKWECPACHSNDYSKELYNSSEGQAIVKSGKNYEGKFEIYTEIDYKDTYECSCRKCGCHYLIDEVYTKKYSN